MDDLQYKGDQKMKKITVNYIVLNLVINGWPSILKNEQATKYAELFMVLNLVINGWPSILR